AVAQCNTEMKALADSDALWCSLYGDMFEHQPQPEEEKEEMKEKIGPRKVAVRRYLVPARQVLPGPSDAETWKAKYYNTLQSGEDKRHEYEHKAHQPVPKTKGIIYSPEYYNRNNLSLPKGLKRNLPSTAAFSEMLRIRAQSKRTGRCYVQ